MVSRFEATILFYVFMAATAIYLASLVWEFLTSNPIVLLVMLIFSLIIFGNAAYKAWSDVSATPSDYLDELDSVERYGLITKTGAVMSAVFFIPVFLMDSFNIIIVLEIIGLIMLLLGIELEHRASGGEKWSYSE